MAGEFMTSLRGEKTISKDALKPGDHIYSYRIAYTYCHHGIYEGYGPNGTVIHFMGNMGGGSFSSFSSSSHHHACSKCGDQSKLSGVIRSCLDCFLKGSDNLYIYEYSKCDPPEEVLSRARFLLKKEKGFGDYCLTKNNCEDFAIFCKTGTIIVDKKGKPVRPRSTQVNKANTAFNVLSSLSNPLAILNLLPHPTYEKKISVETFYNEYRYIA